MAFTTIAPYNMQDLGSSVIIDVSGSKALPITSSLLFWVDLQNPNSIITGSRVQQMGDWSGNNNHFRQTNASIQPDYSGSDSNFGGLPSVVFNGVTQSFLVSVSQSQMASTFYAVFKINSYINSGRLYSAGSDPYDMIGFNTSASQNMFAQVYSNLPAGGNLTNRVSFVPSSSVTRYGAVFDPPTNTNAVPRVIVNGVFTGSIVTATLVAGKSLSTNFHWLGTSAGGICPHINLVAAIGFSTQHTADEMALMDTWLQSRYQSNATLTNRYRVSTGSWFTAHTGTIEDINYRNLLTDFTSFLSSSGYGTWNGFYNFNTRKLNLSSSFGSLGANLRFVNPLTNKIFGGMSGSYISQSSYISAYTPWFHWSSTESEWSKQTLPYEGKGIVKEESCDDGRVYQLSNEDGIRWISNIRGNYKWSDWKFVFENKSNVFNDFSSSNPYVWQQHLNHVRSYLPFAVYQHSSSVVSGTYEQRQGTYKIRADQSKFAPEYSITNDDQYWNVPVNTRQLSLGNNFNTYNSPSETGQMLPTSINDCLIWLRSDLGIELDVNGTVKYWRDQSGNGNDFHVTNSLSQPTYTSSFATMNSLPVVRFGNGKFLHTSTSSQVQYSSCSNATMFFVRRVNTLAGNDLFFSTQPNRNVSTPGQLAFFGSGGPQNFIWSFCRTVSNNTSTMSSSMIYSASNNNIINVNYSLFNSSSNVQSITVNGTSFTMIPIAVPPSGSVITNGVTFLNSFGGSTTSTEMADAYYQEFIFFRRKLLDSEIESVNNYLRNRYGYY